MKINLLLLALVALPLSALPRRRAGNEAASMAGMFTLTSSAFRYGGQIPERYSCDGKDISPQLQWSNPPAKTQSFCIVFHDPDALGGPWNHWVVANIPGNVDHLDEQVDITAIGGLLCTNSWDEKKYSGPCPPLKEHRYVFTIYAIDIPTLPITSDAHRKDIIKAMEGHLLAKDELSGRYQRLMSKPMTTGKS